MAMASAASVIFAACPLSSASSNIILLSSSCASFSGRESLRALRGSRLHLTVGVERRPASRRSGLQKLGDVEAVELTNESIKGLSVRVSNKRCGEQKAPGTRVAAQADSGKVSASSRVVHGQCFVLGDNIDTDQIIPAEYLTLVPSKADEYEKLGSYAMIGLPAKWGRFIEEGQTKTKYAVMIGGYNFGCGSSREHAPVALGASGVRVVVAESYARIFFRNSVATGEVYPVESEQRIFHENSTGDTVTVDLDNNLLFNHTKGKAFALKPIGDAGPVIEAGGIFAYARKTGMIAAKK